MRRFFALILITLCSGTAQAAPAVAMQRWALISSAAVAKTALPDLLTAELSRAADIQLVERDQLAAALKEQEVATLLGADAKGRLALGKVLKADVLAILSDEADANDANKRWLVLCIADSATGARLTRTKLALSDDKYEQLSKDLAQAIHQTRARFPQGVKVLLGLPQFLSKDLTHDYDYLRQTLPSLIENSLFSTPGVAVVEIDEARAIRTELDIANAKIAGRIVPLFIQGEYRTSRPPSGNVPLLSVRIEITDASKAARVLECKLGPLNQAAKLLTGDVPTTVLNSIAGGYQPLTVQRQLELLGTRADAFAATGSWEQSVHLREAALVLDPTMVAQRKHIISESCQLMDEAMKELERQRSASGRRYLNAHPGVWTSAAHMPETDDAIYQKQMADAWELYRPEWLRCADHAEYIAHQPSTRFDEIIGAIALVNRARLPMVCLTLARPHERHEVQNRIWAIVKGCEPRLRELAAAIPPPKKIDRNIIPEGTAYFPRPSGAETLRGFLWESALCAPPSREEIARVIELIKEFPDDPVTPPPYAAYELFRGVNIVQNRQRLAHPDADGDYQAFVDALFNSNKPSLVLCAKIARILMKDNLERRVRPRQVIRDEIFPLRQETTRLAQDDQLWYYVTEMIRSATFESDPFAGSDSTPHEAPAPSPPRQEVMQPEGPISYREYEIKVNTPDRGPIPIAKWDNEQKYGNYPLNLTVIPGGKGPDGRPFDVVWHSNAVFLHRSPAILDPILAETNELRRAVIFDGRQIWAATGKHGLSVFDTSGKIIANLGPEQGLPSADQGIVMAALAQNRVFLCGSFGDEYRGWCAIVERTGDGPNGFKINVFHKATHAPDPEDARTHRMEGLRISAQDPEMIFHPAWVAVAPPGPDSPAGTIWVGREHINLPVGNREWLRIDPQTLKVSVYWPKNYQPTRPIAFIDHDSAIINSGNLFRFQPDKPFEDGKLAHLLFDDRPYDVSGDLLTYQGKMYFSGPHWAQFDPVTWKVTRIGPGVKVYSSLSRQIHYANSQVFGLIAWFEKSFFQISLDPSHPLSIHASNEIGFQYGNPVVQGRKSVWPNGQLIVSDARNFEFKSGKGQFQIFKRSTDTPWLVFARPLVHNYPRDYFFRDIQRVLHYTEEQKRLNLTPQQIKRLTELVPVPETQSSKALSPKFTPLMEAYESAADDNTKAKALDAIFTAVRETAEANERRDESADKEIKTLLTPAQLRGVTFQE